EALSLVGTRPQRTHKRPRQAVLPKRHRLLYVVERRRPKGRGQTQLPPPQDTRLPNPKRSFPDGRLTRLLHFTVEWANENMGFDSGFELVIDGTDRQTLLQLLERLLNLDQLQIEPPQRAGIIARDIGAQQIAAFAPPRLPYFLPVQRE